MESKPGLEREKIRQVNCLRITPWCSFSPGVAPRRSNATYHLEGLFDVDKSLLKLVAGHLRREKWISAQTSLHMNEILFANLILVIEFFHFCSKVIYCLISS